MKPCHWSRRTDLQIQIVNRRHDGIGTSFQEGPCKASSRQLFGRPHHFFAGAFFISSLHGRSPRHPDRFRISRIFGDREKQPIGPWHRTGRCGQLFRQRSLMWRFTGHGQGESRDELNSFGHWSARSSKAQNCEIVARRARLRELVQVVQESVDGAFRIARRRNHRRMETL